MKEEKEKFKKESKKRIKTIENEIKVLQHQINRIIEENRKEFENDLNLIIAHGLLAWENMLKQGYVAATPIDISIIKQRINTDTKFYVTLHTIIHHIMKSKNLRELITSSTKKLQPESLCHMKYQCQECGSTESIWNSRPRVTPFTIGCINCKGMMIHVAWDADTFDPNYQPKKGDRIFVDLTIEKWQEFCHKWVDFYWKPGEDYSLSDCYKTKEEAFQEKLKEWSFGQPDLITI